MKFVVFGARGRLGLIEGGRVMDLMAAAHGAGAESRAAAFHSLTSLIEAGQAGLDLVAIVSEKVRGSDQPGIFTDLAEAHLRAPWAGGRLLMAGMNFAEHVAQAFANKGEARTADQVHAGARKGGPAAFWAVATPVMGPEARIEIPARAAGYFDYEAEPAVVLGRPGKDIRASDFSALVWGVTNVIDWSIRDAAWPPPALDGFVSVKNFDYSKSIGPCISVGEIKPEDLIMETRVNGDLRQSFPARDMIFSFGEIAEYVSRDFTFHPGDVISGGTGPGTAIDQAVLEPDGRCSPSLFLKPGDVVEVSSQIGSLVSHLVPKST